MFESCDIARAFRCYNERAVFHLRSRAVRSMVQLDISQHLTFLVDAIIKSFNTPKSFHIFSLLTIVKYFSCLRHIST